MGIGLFSVKCDVCKIKMGGDYINITGKNGYPLYIICNKCHDTYKHAVLGKFINNKVLYPGTANEMAEINSNGSNSAAIIEKLAKSTLNREIKLEKNAQSIEDFVGGFETRFSESWKNAVSDIIHSMSENEELIYAFMGSEIGYAALASLVKSYVGIVTNKYFYYVGFDGLYVEPKTGYIELEAIRSMHFESGAIKIRLEGDSYLLYSYDSKLVKEKLDEGIRACKNVVNSSTMVQNNVSVADEIKKFKELLDMGVITQEEFDAKKKQLLGI